MKVTPIIFSAPMIRALLDGRKSQTRRVAKPQPRPKEAVDFWQKGTTEHPTPRLLYGLPEQLADNEFRDSVPCPYGGPGDVLWCRETWAAQKDRCWSQGALFYRATDGDCWGKQLPLTWAEREQRWRPSIHMPRWASRLTLRLTDVRVERLQEIDETDALAEGVAPDGDPRWNPVQAFEHLWTGINGPGSWEANPWVWVLSFEVIKANVDQVLREAA